MNQEKITNKIITIRVPNKMYEMLKLVSTLYANRYSHYIIQLIENDMEKNWDYYMKEIERIKKISERK